MRNNVITAVAGDSLYIKTDPVFQYDYGLRLVIEGTELPVQYEVQFGNAGEESAKTVLGDETGVLVPDEYLRSGSDIHAWVYLHTGENDGETVYHIHTPVIGRHAISEEEITPIQHDYIEEALEALAKAVDQTEANVKQYPYINEDKYWMVYDAEKEKFVNTWVKAQGDNTFDLSIGTVTTLPPGSDATASITWHDGNASLNLGIPAGDSRAMVSIHDERINQPVVEIADAAKNILLDDIQVAITPAQSGSGTPGPRNIRRISGWTELNLYHTGDNLNDHYQVSFENDAGVVYGGMFYPLTGKLVVDRVLITKSCRDMNSSDVVPGWKNAGIRQFVGEGVARIFENETVNVGTSYGVDTTGDNDLLYLGYDQYHMRQTEWINTEINVQICLRLAEPIEYQYDPIALQTEYGNNTFRADTGNIAYLRYSCDTKLYIDKKIAETQALALEN